MVLKEFCQARPTLLIPHVQVLKSFLALSLEVRVAPQTVLPERGGEGAA
jgi:hypothetical protein